MIKKVLLLSILLLSFIAPIFALDAVEDDNYEKIYNPYSEEINVEEIVIDEEVVEASLVNTEPKLKIGAASHLFFETAMLYGYPTVGGTWDFGINIDTITISLYTRFLHFFRPLGSETGKLAVAEEMTEIGLSFKVRFYELGRFNVNMGINTGWYQQWLMFGSNAGTYNMINNGLMVRPEASIGWNLVGWWNVELGLFFQTPLYPTYDGYTGWGVYLKLV